MEPGYFIDKEELESKYLGLQMMYHPDRLTGKSETEKVAIIKRSADINEGYDVLRDDVERANHLLALTGFLVNREKDNSFKPSQNLLIEQMELRERAAEESDLGKLLDLVEEDFDRTRKEFSKNLDAKNFGEAAQSAMKLKYLDKLKTELEKH
jgi:molecular chaperone HscB